MAEARIDGADLWFPAEVEIVETIRFIDRRYLGVVTHRPSTNVFYASLMRREQPEPEHLSEGWTVIGEAYWAAHTLNEAMTDSAGHAKQMVMAAYAALEDRVAGKS
jgi:hypothetical protein